MRDNSRRGMKPHSRKNPPKPARKAESREKRGFEFILVPPSGPGQVPLAMSKRPVAKE